MNYTHKCAFCGLDIDIDIDMSVNMNVNANVNANANANVECSGAVVLNTTPAEPAEYEHPTLPFLPPIFPESPTVLIYSGKRYHTRCLLNSTLNIVKHNESITLNLEFKISELIHLVNCIRNSPVQSSVSKRLSIRVSSIICEHDSDYIVCSNTNCNKLMLRRDCIIGEKTKSYQQILIKQSTEDIKPDDKDYKKDGTSYKVLYFCSKQCDGYFSSHLHNLLENRLKLAIEKIKDIDDRAERQYTSYISVQGIRSETELKRIRGLIDTQAKVKKMHEGVEAKKDVKSIVKKVFGF